MMSADLEVFEVESVDHTGSQITIQANNKIACGSTHTAIIKNDASVWSAGSNGYGAFGANNTTSSTVFVESVSTELAMSISAGLKFSSFINEHGDVFGSGYNDVGQLGTTSGNKLQFTQADTNGSNAIVIACGGRHNMIIKDDGNVWGTGLNWQGAIRC